MFNSFEVRSSNNMHNTLKLNWKTAKAAMRNVNISPHESLTKEIYHFKKTGISVLGPWSLNKKRMKEKKKRKKKPIILSSSNGIGI